VAAEPLSLATINTGLELDQHSTDYVGVICQRRSFFIAYETEALGYLKLAYQLTRRPDGDLKKSRQFGRTIATTALSDVRAN
jgi:hypothetical protein